MHISIYPIKNPKIDFSIENQVSIYENESEISICNEDIINGELHKYIDDTVKQNFKDIYLYNNPDNEFATKEWGYSNKKEFIVHSDKTMMDKLLWVCPKPGSKLPTIAIKNTIQRHNKLKILPNFQELEFKVEKAGFGRKSTIKYGDEKKPNHQALGVINSSCKVLLYRRKATGEWIYFFPNTESEVDIVFDVIDKLGFFEGWEKNPDYKKSSQDDTIIATEAENSIDESIHYENTIETETIEENTVKNDIVGEIEVPTEISDFVTSEHEDNYEIDYRPEGREKVVMQTVYERNPENRRICIAHYKHEDDDKRIKCQVCGFDFEAVYGDLGRDFIEVHHKIPLSETRREIYIDPKEDLIPVCSNCHRILHRGNNGNDYSKNLATLQALFPKKNNT